MYARIRIIVHPATTPTIIPVSTCFALLLVGVGPSVARVLIGVRANVTGILTIVVRWSDIIVVLTVR